MQGFVNEDLSSKPRRKKWQTAFGEAGAPSRERRCFPFMVLPISTLGGKEYLTRQLHQPRAVDVQCYLRNRNPWAAENIFCRVFSCGAYCSLSLQTLQPYWRHHSNTVGAFVSCGNIVFLIQRKHSEADIITHGLHGTIRAWAVCHIIQPFPCAVVNTG